MSYSNSTSGDVLRQYVGVTPLGAGMVSAAIERSYPKRLLSAGWWQMGLFQRSARKINLHIDQPLVTTGQPLPIGVRLAQFEE